MITQRDLKILRHLTSLKYLNTRQIESIFPYKGRTQKIIVVRNRMREMEKEGLVLSHQPSKYSSKIFYLSKKGMEFCKREFGLENIKTGKKGDKMFHGLKVTDFFISLLLLKYPYKLEKYSIELEFNLRGRTLRPDGFFLLRYPDNRARLGLVEVDMGTETLTYVVSEKKAKYEALYNTQGFQRKYKTFPQVYFLVKSEERAKSLQSRFDSENNTPIKFKIGTFDEAFGDIIKFLGG